MNEILQILFEQYKYDIAVMSQPWMYYWLLIPIAVYSTFFCLKWMILTGPLWLPIYAIMQAWRSTNKKK